MQVSPVTMPSPSLRAIAPPPCLPLGIKYLLKEDMRLLAFWMWEAFRRENCWREIAEGGK
jgi:hypothetical protein